MFVQKPKSPTDTSLIIWQKIQTISNKHTHTHTHTYITHTYIHTFTYTHTHTLTHAELRIIQNEKSALEEMNC